MDLAEDPCRGALRFVAVGFSIGVGACTPTSSTGSVDVAPARPALIAEPNATEELSHLDPAPPFQWMRFGEALQPRPVPRAWSHHAVLEVGDTRFVATHARHTGTSTLEVSLPYHTSYFHRFKHREYRGGARVRIDLDTPMGDPVVMMTHGPLGPTILVAAPLDHAYRILELSPGGSVAQDRTFALPPGGHDERQLQFTLDGHLPDAHLTVYGRPTSAASEAIPAFVDQVDWKTGWRTRHRDVSLHGHFFEYRDRALGNARAASLPHEAFVEAGQISYTPRKRSVDLALTSQGQTRWTTSVPRPKDRDTKKLRVLTGGSADRVFAAFFNWPRFGADIYVLDAATGEVVDTRTMIPPEFWSRGFEPMGENSFRVAHFEDATVFIASNPGAGYAVAFDSKTARWIGTEWGLE